jgi:PKHD-type hydroxylase
MLVVIESAIEACLVGELVGLLERVPFEDGKATAGWSARLVKQNTQASADPAIDMWRDRIAGLVAQHPMFQIAAMPKRIIGPLFSRYGVGDAYGAHVDEPVMDGARVDLSFTLFLSAPETYDGGELSIDSTAGVEAHKHAAGSLVLYPTTSLHFVSPVTRGVRYAAVGWVRSLVRDAARRELLFDLETARRSQFDRYGKTSEHDLLSKCHANLVRMWCDD